jgi:hypothetical protein
MTFTVTESEKKEYNPIADKYGLTLNQVKGFIKTCDNLNRKQLDSTGITAVPFWFMEQYLETARLNKALSEQVDRLKTVIATSTNNAKSAIIKQSSNIITGLSEPYIPGVTGPRLGDEALDKDREYFPNGVNKG